MFPQEKCRTKASLARHLQPVEFFTVIDRPVKKSCPPISLNLRYERDSSTDRIERDGEEPVGQQENGGRTETPIEPVLGSQQETDARGYHWAN
jgi:hypothetical protein